MGKKKTISKFYRFRLKWMPFANLTIIGIAIFALFQLPHATVEIIEPAVNASINASKMNEVGSPFNLRVKIDNTLGCAYQPSSLRALITPVDGTVITIKEFEQDRDDWLASNVELPMGEYQLTVSVMASCEDDAIKNEMNIKVVCKPLTVAQAKANGDVCGEFVADNCGGFVELPSCVSYGESDPRVNNPKLNCKQTGYYVGKSSISYVENAETQHYYVALKCGSGNNTECYEQPNKSGSCKRSKSPEAFSYYGNKDDPGYHKCRIECTQ